MLFILRVGCVSGILFIDIKREVVLVGLKSTNQLSAQWCIVPRFKKRYYFSRLNMDTRLPIAETKIKTFSNDY